MELRLLSRLSPFFFADDVVLLDDVVFVIHKELINGSKLNFAIVNNKTRIRFQDNEVISPTRACLVQESKSFTRIDHRILWQHYRHEIEMFDFLFLLVLALCAKPIFSTNCLHC